MQFSEDFRSHVLQTYNAEEPGEADTWNPLYNDFDLGYRCTHLYTLTKCLRIVDPTLSQMKVLDVGCGNGRSTRAYLSVGLSPEQLTGIDIREGAINLASRLNPAINYETYYGNEIEYPDNTFNWIQLAAVFTTSTTEHRKFLAEEVMRVLKPGGHIYYLGLWFSKTESGHKPIRAENYFPNMDILFSSPVRAHQGFPYLRQWRKFYNQPTFSERLSSFLRIKNRIRNIIFPSHHVMLVKKPL